MVLTIFLEVIFVIMCGFFGIVVGHRFNNKKMLKSLLFGAGVYFVSNSITGIILVLGSIFSTDLYNMLFTAADNSLIEYRFLCILVTAASIIYLIYSGILYLLINKNLDKGINID